MSIELRCVYCDRECWHNSKAPTLDFLERVAVARGWRKLDLPPAFGPPPHWMCDGCVAMSAELQRVQD